METMNTETKLLPDGEAPSNAVEAVIAHIKAGGIAYVATYSRVTVIDAKTLAKFEKAGEWILKADKDGRGYRLRQGRGSVYLFAGQLKVRGPR